MEPSTMKFKPMRAAPQASFFKALGEAKLQQWKLDDRARPAWARIVPAIRTEGGLRLEASSLGEHGRDAVVAAGTDRLSPTCPGHVLCFNTLEQMQKADKAAVLGAAAALVWADIVSGRALDSPGLLARFVVACHADMKQHKFVLWPAFPALVPEDGLVQEGEALPASAGLSAGLGVEPAVVLEEASEAVAALMARSPAGLPLAFVLARRDGKLAAQPLREAADRGAASLRADLATRGLVLVVVDPSPLARHAGWTARNALVMASVCLGLGGEVLPVLCLRPSPRGAVVDPPDHARPDEASAAAAGESSAPTATTALCGSIVVRVRCPGLEGVAAAAVGPPPGEALAGWLAADAAPDAEGTSSLSRLPRGLSAAGWERQPVRAKDGSTAMLSRPRVVDLGRLLDPAKLAESAGRLNLSLMRWRALPGLDQPLLEGMKCLLLGAGTLGCHVSRCLLAWGVRSITFVDNGSVAHSNPVRQPLFEFADAAAGAKSSKKAIVAALALKRVSPVCQPRGVVLTIPMPGHAEDLDASMAAAAELRRLIEESDVVFALTDTRESRWLPTLLCRASNTPLINAALGFDSWLVMRHGLDATRPVSGALAPPASPPLEPTEATRDSPAAERSVLAATSSAAAAGAGAVSSTGPAPTVGCYFCSDVVGPLNTTRGRTMDQQCTVTRPGLAPIAAAHAVELLVNMAHHPARALAPAAVRSADAGAPAPAEAGVGTGPVPHQLRGFMATFSTMQLEAAASTVCTACSANVVGALDARGDAFIRAAIEDPDLLERASGLEAMKAEADALAEAAGGDDWAMDEDF
ncbi:hypothetical protein FNF29_00546 [Cafeteria roenbergensis]|uniref:Autophagy-related protein 7 n=1 Tax=Cafeteria roenbergensis TaxID=33653 RepID=A0A5A8CXE2_CAFRO|nr:hypothetical protein FNF29_00546 [Cafeteria roenbergensis]|eukprot:KAA0157194.1 hypothetical protein FNF29_00546 [Cafeteria roenbergensis]